MVGGPGCHLTSGLARNKCCQNNRWTRAERVRN
jgi:hypothetical protein